MLDEMLKKVLNKPIVITIEQLQNVQLFVRETEEGIETIPLDEYLTLKVTERLLTLMNGGE